MTRYHLNSYDCSYALNCLLTPGHGIVHNAPPRTVSVSSYWELAPRLPSLLVWPDNSCLSDWIYTLLITLSPAKVNCFATILKWLYNKIKKVLAWSTPKGSLTRWLLSLAVLLDLVFRLPCLVLPPSSYSGIAIGLSVSIYGGSYHSGFTSCSKLFGLSSPSSTFRSQLANT